MFTVSGTHESAWSPAGRQLGREDGGEVGRAGTRWNHKHELSPTGRTEWHQCLFLSPWPFAVMWVSAKHTPGPQERERLKVEQELLIRWKWNLRCSAAAAAAAKLRQSCPTLCDPRDGSPPGSPIPGILQARTLEWVAISFSNAWKWKVKVKALSCVWLLATPWTAAYQAPPSMGFSRQEYWSGVPLPSP